MKQNDKNEDFTNDVSDDISITEIDPRDTYGDRFEVRSRRILNTPRSAISTKRRLKKSEKIFSRHHDNVNLGGHVNIENINKAKEKKLISQDKDGSTVNMSNNFNDNFNVNNVQKTQVPVSDNFADDSVSQETSNDNRSSGLDSLFSSTVNILNKNDETNKDTKRVSENFNNVDDSEDDADSTFSYSDSADKTSEIDITASQRRIKFNSVQDSAVGNRELKILCPRDYSSAKEISSALRLGCALVLCLKKTIPSDAKRLLDFSFGAASMCGATVSIGAEKTYVFTTGGELTHKEKLLCANEGVGLRI